MIRAALALVLIAGTAQGAVLQERTETGTGAVLRGLDKLTGHVTDLEVDNGGYVTFGRVTIGMAECRYPEGDPAGDAFAFLSIAENNGTDVFQGWMVASSPALNPMDHARYDVWVLRCKTASGTASSGTE